MKFVKYFLLLILSMLVVSCSKDDEPELEKTTDDLIYTSWEGVYRGLDSKGELFTYKVILQFLTETQGQYFVLDGAGNPINPSLPEVWYDFDGPVITFNGSLTGRWTITKRSKHQLKLEAYKPYKSELDLKKIF